MKIETKFSNGDTVYAARQDYGPDSLTDCPECHGKGSFGIEGKPFQRLKCTGFRCRDGKIQAYALKPYATKLTIGQVRVQITDSPGQPGGSEWDNYRAQHGREERYMAIETGIGSGSLHDADGLFRTEEEAVAYASAVLIPQRLAWEKEEDERRERDRQARLRQIESEDAA